LIEVRNLRKTFRATKRFPGFKGAVKGLFTREYTETRAVDGVSFDIPDGQIVGYIGANGAGKSTTIKMMTGILTPTSGSVVVNGLVPYERRMENAANIGVVFGQRTQLWWDLPLSESFSLLKDIYDVSDADYERRMAFLDSVLGLAEFMMSPVRTLSLGQRMRADLAASLVHQPRILYLDEPTIGLDLVVKDRVRGAIKDINREFGTTIILTTHDLDDIEELCSRIIVIDAGRIVWDGSIVELRERYGWRRELRLRLGGPDGGRDTDQALATSLRALDPASTLVRSDEELVVGFDRRTLGVGSVVQAVMSSCEVLDYSIRETKIEEIVKLIYAGEIRS
jgi:ABC-2 type transport system ATP-binding protein